jgi:hypothetical protein
VVEGRNNKEGGTGNPRLALLLVELPSIGTGYGKRREEEIDADDGMMG